MTSLLLLVLLCGRCMTAEATDVSSQISELIKEFREHMMGIRNFKLNEITMKDIDNAEINKIIALSKIIERDVNKSQAFWEKLEKKEKIDDAEISAEEKREMNLIDFVEKVKDFFEIINMDLEKEKDEFCEKTLNDVSECFSQLTLLKSHNEEGDCSKRMDFQAVRKTLSYYVDYIKFFHLNLMFSKNMRDLFPEFDDKIESNFWKAVETDKFWKTVVLFHNQYNEILSYLDNSSFKAYASVGRQKMNMFFKKTRALIESCEETSAEIDKLVGKKKYADTARRLINKLDVECKRHVNRMLNRMNSDFKDIFINSNNINKLDVECKRHVNSDFMDTGFKGFNSSNVVEVMLLIADYCKYIIRLVELQHVSNAHQKALA